MGDSAETSDSAFIEPATLATWILEKREIWQERFLEASEFTRFCADRGIGMANQTINRLWQLGLLRADLIVTTRKLRRAGFVPMGRIGREKYAYADNRAYKHYPAGLGAAAANLKEIDASERLYFHPFRFYVIWQYEALCRLFPTPSAMTSSRGLSQLRKVFAQLQARSGSERSVARFAEANSAASLAIASEPCAYPGIFHRLRFPIHRDEATQRKEMADHWEKLVELYTKIGEEPVARAWKSVCLSSSDLERNSSLHEKLRLARNEVREKRLRGPLAGALFLKTTAEVLRRTAEQIFSKQWPEEGEGWDGGSYKLRQYGTRRIFDGKGRIRDEVLREYWPDFGLHVRWYVEGDTEWEALNSFFGPNPSGIDLVNLGGRFDKRLLDHLQNDLKNGIYSFVSLDGDRSDNLRALRQAVEKGKFFGVWYVSKPDFEFANFSLAELQDILWQMAIEQGARPSGRAKLNEYTDGADCKGKLQKGARKLHELTRFSTGKDWGRRLIAYAQEHPTNEKGEERPILAALRDGLRGAEGMFAHSIDFSTMRVDPVSGKLVKR